MLLRVTDYHDITRWRWELQDDAGNHLADHEVNLYPTAQEYKGYDDPSAGPPTLPPATPQPPAPPGDPVPGDPPPGDPLPGNNPPPSNAPSATGSATTSSAPRAPSSAQTSPSPPRSSASSSPPEAQDLLFRPFELAHLETGGRPLPPPSALRRLLARAAQATCASRPP